MQKIEMCVEIWFCLIGKVQILVLVVKKNPVFVNIRAGNIEMSRDIDQ